MKSINPIEAFEDSNGKVFKSRKEAIASQFKINLWQFFRDHGICQGGEWSQDMVINEILNHLEDFKEILQFGELE